MVPKAPAIHQQRDSGDARQGLDVETHYVGRELGKAFGRAPPPAPFDADVATFDVTEVTKSPYERIRSR